MIAYVVQAICFQAIFLAVYYLLLRKETFFVCNRIYLLVTPVIALLLPFVKIASLQTVVPMEVMSVMLPEVVIGDATTSQAEQTSSFVIPWLSIYFVGVAVSALLLVIKFKSFISYLSFKRRGEHIINVPNSTEAFTFFKYIFIGEDIDTLSRKQILTHEQIHAKQGHTWDLIFFEIMKIIFWFNPLIYFNQKLISTVHEYLADQKATAATSKKAYYEELLNTAFGTNNLSFTNTFFNQSLIKNRIIMLQKSKSKKSALIKYFLIAPLILAMLVQVSWAQNSSKSGEVERENFTLMESDFNNEKVNYSIIIIDTLKLASNEKAFLEAIHKNKSLDVSDFDLIEDKSSTLNGMDKLLMFSSKDDIVELKEKFDIKSYTVEELRKKYKLKNTYTSQAIYKEEVEVVETQEELEIPFAVIDNVPTYPGCNELEGNEDKKTCMSDKVSKYVSANFNTSIAKPLGLTGVNRVFVSFRINKRGQVDNVEARASHPDIAEEARRVIYNLPQMKPGSQAGEEVGVLYSLPITFKIAE
ncbi:M56 family metallopeptidase [uncultured Dokdonia sp.]|uniref:M56 family metallopeptidase n=1 Tax=unclassified Dokdonia TaxID=2615033 RepID=UPI00260B708F|nr:M56 family metallopeptidase [uncultured Dokdonia sp.]